MNSDQNQFYITVSDLQRVRLAIVALNGVTDGGVCKVRKKLEKELNRLETEFETLTTEVVGGLRGAGGEDVEEG